MENKVEIQMAVLDTKMKTLEENVDKIMNNHLPHIHEKLEDIEKKQAYYAGAIAVFILLLDVFLKFYIK